MELYVKERPKSCKDCDLHIDLLDDNRFSPMTCFYAQKYCPLKILEAHDKEIEKERNKLREELENTKLKVQELERRNKLLTNSLRDYGLNIVDIMELFIKSTKECVENENK